MSYTRLKEKGIGSSKIRACPAYTLHTNSVVRRSTQVLWLSIFSLPGIEAISALIAVVPSLSATLNISFHLSFSSRIAAISLSSNRGETKYTEFWSQSPMLDNWGNLRTAFRSFLFSSTIYSVCRQQECC